MTARATRINLIRVKKLAQSSSCLGVNILIERCNERRAIAEITPIRLSNTFLILSELASLTKSFIVYVLVRLRSDLSVLIKEVAEDPN
jgi:hypothetical protein